VSNIQYQQVVVPDGVIDLGVGQPNHALLPFEHVRQAAPSLLDDGPESLQYGAEWGDGHHRVALAEHLSVGYGVPIAPEHLFSTNGTSQALDMVCTVMSVPGDVVIVEDPTYFLAFQIFRDHGLDIRTAPMDGEGIDVAAVVRIVTDVRAAGGRVAFVYVVPAFHNPTSITMSQRRRDDLAAAASAIDVPVLADEVYHLLRHAPGAMPLPMSAYVERAPVVSLGTFSKILAPGLRLGWIHAAPSRLEPFAASGLIVSGGGLNPISSGLATAMIRTGRQAEHLAFVQATLGRRCAAMVAALRATCSDRVSFDVPDGGYFIWLRLPAGISGTQAREAGRREGVDVRHGALFSAVGAPDDHLRLSFAYYDEPDIVEGVRRLARALSSLGT